MTAPEPACVYEGLMKRFFRWLAVCGVWAFSVALQAADRPNVLFLFSDDQRADTIAALGNAHLKTPHLDRLVKDGTAFTRAYCMGSNQGAVCVPSRAMLMSGRTLYRVHEQLKGVPTWPESFATAGYRTYMTGKWHNGAPSALRVFQEGEAVFLGGMGDPDAIPVQDMAAPEPGGPRRFVNKRTVEKHCVELFADKAVEFLQAQQQAAQPWLCYVSFNAPHDPRKAPAEWHERTNASKPPVPENFLPVHPFNNGEMTVRDEKLAPWPRTEAVIKQELADYYAAIMFMDAQIGRILEALRATGQDEKTIIVFTSDHGLALGSHGLMGKQSLYDHSMHSPLIVAGPGVPKGEKRDALCYLLDVYPTLGELAGVAKPEGSEGLSLVPLLKGAETTRRQAIMTGYRNVQRAVRDDQWKLIVYPQVNKMQLYNLKSDPAETKDLAQEPGNAEEIDRMRTLLEKLQKENGDTQVLRTEHPLPLEFNFGGQGAGDARRQD